MAIPKKQLNLIVELMEALPLDGTVYEMPLQVEFIPHDEIYIGYFDTTVIDDGPRKRRVVGCIPCVFGALGVQFNCQQITMPGQCGQAGDMIGAEIVEYDRDFHRLSDSG